MQSVDSPIQGIQGSHIGLVPEGSPSVVGSDSLNFLCQAQRYSDGYKFQSIVISKCS